MQWGYHQLFQRFSKCKLWRDFKWCVISLKQLGNRNNYLIIINPSVKVQCMVFTILWLQYMSSITWPTMPHYVKFNMYINLKPTQTSVQYVVKKSSSSASVDNMEKKKLIQLILFRISLFNNWTYTKSTQLLVQTILESSIVPIKNLEIQGVQHDMTATYTTLCTLG